jgi:LmbE family N-acetylglucosaminyl deacetylase
VDPFGGSRPWFLQDLPIPASLRVAILAPHPDDFDAIGITLRHLRANGNPLALAVLTSGASGVEDGFGGAYTKEAKGMLRETEQRESCHFFGLPEDQVAFLRLVEDAEGHPAESHSNCDQVRAFLLDKLPDLIFMPHGNDSNAAHRRTYRFFRRIAQEERLTLTACLNRDPKTLAMRSDLYTLFSDAQALWKAELLRFHRSQHQRNLNQRGFGFDERILRENQRNAAGWEARGSHAEVFELEFYAAGRRE